MERVRILDINKNKESFDNKKIKVSGWVKTLRSSKAFAFMEINDGSFFKNLQVVIESKNIKRYDDIVKTKLGSAVTIEGTLVLTPNNKQPFEIKASDILIDGQSTDDFPLQKKRHGVEFLREIAHLRPRTNLFRAVFKIRSEMAIAIHEFFNKRDFVYVNTPIITGSDCEGAGDMFKVTTLDLLNIPRNNDKVDYSKDFFGKETNLTVSGQLNLEAFNMAFDKTYTFGPTFRAENSNTSRHASEFWMLEPEIAFADLDDNIKLAQDMIKYLVNHLLEKCSTEIEFINKFVDKNIKERLEKLRNTGFKKITYTEAVDVLKNDQDSEKVKFEYPVKWGIDLQSEHEKYLTDKVFNSAVVVVNYPKEIKAFYMRLNDDNKTVAAMDVLLPGIGEMIGGSQREERLDVLEKRISEMGLDKNDYSWYLDLRKFGTAKHAGFGLGFDRFLMYITGVKNIKDVIPFPRTPKNSEY